MAEPFSYDGFISYSHAADGLLAPRLQAGLQRFAKPWWKRRAMRLFRDESSLSANPHLWSSITEALDSSGWFVLLLSPEAASSEWVGQEIEYWIANRDASRILPVVTDGEFGWSDGDVVGDAVPEALRGVFSEEPRWVDLRWVKDEDQLDLQDPRFADAVADIGSAIRGVPKDELASEEVRQHRRTVRTAWGAGGLVTVLAIAAVFGASVATRAQTRAEEQAALAQGRSLLSAARTVIEEDSELAFLLALEAADLLGQTGEVEEVLHTLLLTGTEALTLDVDDDARSRSHAVAVRPGASQVAATSSGTALHLFDANDGTTIATFGEANGVDSSSVPSIAFDGPGNRIAAIDTLGVARVWDVNSGELLTELDTGEPDTGAVVFAADDTYLITSVYTRIAWDLETGQPIWTNTDPVWTFGGAPISIDRRGNLLAWPSITLGTVTAVDVRTGEMAWQIPLPGAIGVAFHPRFDVVMVKSQFQGIQLLDFSAGQPETFFALESVAPTDVEFSDDGTRLVDRGGEPFGYVYETTDPSDPRASWVEVASFYLGAELPLSFDFLPDGRVAAGLPTQARVFSMEAPGEVARLTVPPVELLEAVPGSDLVWTLHSPNFGLNDVLLHDAATGDTRLASTGPIDPGDWVAGTIVSESVGVMTLPGERSVAVVDPSTGAVRTTLELPPGRPFLFRLVATPDGSTVVGAPDLGTVGELTGELVVWNGATGDIQRVITFDEVGVVQGLAIDPTGSVVAAGGDDGLVLIDLLSDPAVRRRLPAEGNIHGADFSPDGTQLAVADDTFGAMHAYDVQAGERVASISVPGAHDPAFTDDGKQLLFAGAQSGVIAFDTATWDKRWTVGIESLPGATAILTLDVAGDRVVFGDPGGVVFEITLDYDRLLQLASDRIDRALTASECSTYRIDPCPTPEESKSR